MSTPKVKVLKQRKPLTKERDGSSEQPLIFGETELLVLLEAGGHARAAERLREVRRLQEGA